MRRQAKAPQVKLVNLWTCALHEPTSETDRSRCILDTAI